jgi:ATP-dependent Clp protease ATP-binding subunit ClpA
VRIFDIQLQHLADSLHRQGIRLEVSPKARQQLAHSGYSPQYGARPLAGVIRNRLRRPISRMIIGGELTAGHELFVDWSAADELTWSIQAEPAGQANAH